MFMVLVVCIRASFVYHNKLEAIFVDIDIAITVLQQRLFIRLCGN